MENLVFLELTNGDVATFSFERGTGILTPFDAPANRFMGFNQALEARTDLTPAYLLDSGSRAGNGNAWCNFKCSGCYRPLQASRWYLLEGLGGFGGRGTGVQKMRRPENSLGRFIGRRGTELDNAGLRAIPPARTPLPEGIGDGECWLGRSCESLHEFYGVPLDRFF
jgi:hypothetical protein